MYRLFAIGNGFQFLNFRGSSLPRPVRALHLICVLRPKDSRLLINFQLDSFARQSAVVIYYCSCKKTLIVVAHRVLRL